MASAGAAHDSSCKAGVDITLRSLFPFLLNSVEGLPINDRLMTITDIVLRKFPAVFGFALVNWVRHKALLKLQISHVKLV